MIHRLSLAAAWLALAFIVFATLSPLSERPTIPEAGPQLEHFAAFALMGFAFALGYRNRMLLVIAIVIGSAFTLEALQLLTPDRHGRVLDALVKAAGGMTGIGIGYLVPVVLREPINRIREAFGSGRAG